MKTVVGLFDSYAHAEIAAHDLERIGISHDDISLVANSQTAQIGAPNAEPIYRTQKSDTETEAGKGAVAGGVAGLLLSLAAFAIPGLGAIAAAGWLVTTVTGAVVGTGVGIVGVLNGVGVPHDDAFHYNEGVRRGGTLLAVRVQDDQAGQVERILSADGAVDIDERAEQYRQEGIVPPASHTLSTPPVASKPPAVAATSSIPPPPASSATPVPEPASNSAVTAPESTVAVNKVDLGGETTRPDPKTQITRRAYELYEQRGRRDGHALDDWLDAERELQSIDVERTDARATPV